MITGPMCKAARALVEITRSKLATAAGVDEAVIEAFERRINVPEAATVEALQSALEALGKLHFRTRRGRRRRAAEIQPIGDAQAGNPGK